MRCPKVLRNSCTDPYLFYQIKVCFVKIADLVHLFKYFTALDMLRIFYSTNLALLYQLFLACIRGNGVQGAGADGAGS